MTAVYIWSSQWYAIFRRYLRSKKEGLLLRPYPSVSPSACDLASATERFVGILYNTKRSSIQKVVEKACLKFEAVVLIRLYRHNWISKEISMMIEWVILCCENQHSEARTCWAIETNFCLFFLYLIVWLVWNFI